MGFYEDDGCIAAGGILSGGLEPTVEIVTDAVGPLAVMDRQLTGARAAVHRLELAIAEHGRELVEQLLLTGAAHQGLVVEEPQQPAAVHVAQVGGRCPYHRRALR